MAGHFELIDAEDGGCRVRLIDKAGRVLAVSEPYDTTESAVRGIHSIREVAASGLLNDRRTTSEPKES
jgi:uncharacterized protein YegP (UPF0339 family)